MLRIHILVFGKKRENPANAGQKVLPIITTLRVPETWVQFSSNFQ